MFVQASGSTDKPNAASENKQSQLAATDPLAAIVASARRITSNSPNSKSGKRRRVSRLANWFRLARIFDETIQIGRRWRNSARIAAAG